MKEIHLLLVFSFDANQFFSFFSNLPSRAKFIIFTMPLTLPILIYQLNKENFAKVSKENRVFYTIEYNARATKKEQVLLSIKQKLEAEKYKILSFEEDTIAYYPKTGSNKIIAITAKDNGYSGTFIEAKIYDRELVTDWMYGGGDFLLNILGINSRIKKIHKKQISSLLAECIL